LFVGGVGDRVVLAHAGEGGWLAFLGEYYCESAVTYSAHPFAFELCAIVSRKQSCTMWLLKKKRNHQGSIPLEDVWGGV